jgi:catechol 2,3-dioxygenase-like lactoylglutathione lyase family enzyme
MEHPARVTSSVIFVAELGRSVDFYRDLFACEVAIHEPDAALLLAPGGFQIYLIARGTRTHHASGGIGLQCLIWAVDGADDLHNLEESIKGRGWRAVTYKSGGVTFVEGRDPDGIRILIAHPSPDKLPRSLVNPRLYL